MLSTQYLGKIKEVPCNKTRKYLSKVKGNNSNNRTGEEKNADRQREKLEVKLDFSIQPKATG